MFETGVRGLHGRGFSENCCSTVGLRHGSLCLTLACEAHGTVLALNGENVGHNSWVQEVYLLDI